MWMRLKWLRKMQFKRRLRKRSTDFCKKRFKEKPYAKVITYTAEIDLWKIDQFIRKTFKWLMWKWSKDLGKQDLNYLFERDLKFHAKLF